VHVGDRRGEAFDAVVDQADFMRLRADANSVAEKVRC
jgi:hypothetical protein